MSRLARSQGKSKRSSQGCLARFAGPLLLLLFAVAIWLLPKLFPQVSQAGWGLGLIVALLAVGALLRSTDPPQERAHARAQERQRRAAVTQRAEAEWRERREAEESEKLFK